MPEWRTKPEMKNTLDSVVADLEGQVSGDPPFADIAGVEMAQLAAHAAEAIAGFEQANGGTIPTDPSALMQIYVMGFVVGTKYGESRAHESNTP